MTYLLYLPWSPFVATLNSYFWPGWSPVISTLYMSITSRLFGSPSLSQATLNVLGACRPSGHPQLRVTELVLTDRKLISPGGGSTEKGQIDIGSEGHSMKNYRTKGNTTAHFDIILGDKCVILRNGLWRSISQDTNLQWSDSGSSVPVPCRYRNRKVFESVKRLITLHCSL